MNRHSEALLVIQPRAYRHRLFTSLLSHYQRRYHLKVEESQYPGHTRDICRNFLLASPERLVLTAGGDGTFHEAINGWGDLGFPKGVQFAPLPLGTGNDFLYSLEPRLRHPQTYLEQELAFEHIVDLGEVEYQTDEGPLSRYFCVGATAGFSASVCFRRARLAHRIPGSLSYLVSLFLSLSSWRNTRCRINSPDIDQEHSVFFALNCANVKYYGGGMVSAPRAVADSGELEGVAMNLTLPEVLRALPQNFRGNFDGVKNVHQFKISQSMTLTTQRSCLVQADGEPLGETPMTVRCLPAQLPVLLPLPPR